MGFPGFFPGVFPMSLCDTFCNSQSLRSFPPGPPVAPASRLAEGQGDDLLPRAFDDPIFYGFSVGFLRVFF